MRLYPFAVLTIFSAPAWAHVGGHHGNLVATLGHLLSEPDHFAVLALAMGGGVVGALIQRRREK